MIVRRETVRPASRRWRALLEDRDATHQRMAGWEEKAVESARKEEKLRLGLPEAEEILFMAERSRLAHWPVAVLSLTFLVSSALISERGGVAFLLLSLGLAGLALVSAAAGRTKLYLTNFRALLRVRPLLRRKPRWSQVLYPEVRKLSTVRGVGRGSLMLTGEREKLEVHGLGRADLETAARVLRASLIPPPE